MSSINSSTHADESSAFKMSARELKKLEKMKNSSVMEWTPSEWKTHDKQIDLKTLENLAKLPPGTRIYTVLRRVSPSGMSRIIDLFYVQDGQLTSLHFGRGQVFHYQRKDHNNEMGYRVNGCGMDMGWHLVSGISSLVVRYLESIGQSPKMPERTYAYEYFKQEWI